MSDSPSWQQLLDLLKEWGASGLESASLESGDVSFRVSRTGQVASYGPVAGSAPASPTATAEPAASEPPTAAAEGTVVSAPMVGVFYRSPSPGKPPFVAPGASVESSTTIGIIEVMKLMSPVVAGVAGTLIAFDVSDGESIEYGQALARIDPS